MRRTIHICDICGKEHEDLYTPNDWKTAKFEIDGYRNQTIKHYLLCPDCLEKVGLPKPIDVKEVYEEKTKDVSERLYDIFVDLFQSMNN